MLISSISGDRWYSPFNWVTVDISSRQCQHPVPTSYDHLFTKRNAKNSHIHVNYDKIREATQEKDENPALFLPRLTEAVPKYTNLDISTPSGLWRSPIFKPSGTLKAILLSASTVLPIKSSSALSPPPLHIQFISQSAPDIHQKLCQLKKVPETPLWDLLEIAFKVFNNREEEAKKEKGKGKKAQICFIHCSYPRKNSTPLAHQSHLYGM